MQFHANRCSGQVLWCSYILEWPSISKILHLPPVTKTWAYSKSIRYFKYQSEYFKTDFQKPKLIYAYEYFLWSKFPLKNYYVLIHWAWLFNGILELQFWKSLYYIHMFDQTTINQIVVGIEKFSKIFCKLMRKKYNFSYWPHSCDRQKIDEVLSV